MLRNVMGVDSVTFPIPTTRYSSSLLIRTATLRSTAGHAGLLDEQAMHGLGRHLDLMVSRSETARPLLTPGEIMQLAARAATAAAA